MSDIKAGQETSSQEKCTGNSKVVCYKQNNEFMNFALEI